MSPANLLKQFYFTCRIYSSYYIYVVTRLLQCQRTASIPGGARIDGGGEINLFS